MNTEGNMRIFAFGLVLLILVAAAVYELVIEDYLGAGVTICLACMSGLNYTDWRRAPVWRRVAQVIFFIGALIFIVTIFYTRHHIIFNA